MNKPISLQKSIINALSSSKNKNEAIKKLKEIDKNGGGTSWKDPGYMKKDVFNGLIGVCLGAGPFALAIGASPLGIIGTPVGILGLYLTGVVFHMNATKYDKFHLLEYYSKKIENKKKILQSMLKKEKDPVMKKEIQAKINEADRCLTAIAKERRALLPPKERSKVNSDSDLDDLDFDWDDDDWESWDDLEVEESTIIQEKYKEHLNPVYIITSYTATPMGKMIKAYTGDRFSHSCLSLDSTLENMYSYNADNHISKRGGLSFESLSNYIKYNQDSDIRVSVIFLKDKEYAKLKWKLEDYIAHYNTSTYNFLGLFDIITGNTKKKEDEYALICSQFVDHILKLIDIDITDMPSNLVTPGILSRVDNPKVYLIYDGKAIKYDSKAIDKKVTKLINTIGQPIKEYNFIDIYVEPICETKEFPIEFTKEGDLIIKKKQDIDFVEEHRKSKKLYKIYLKNKNYEAMEYEANKLWYMNLLLQKEIESGNTDLYEIRSKVLNEFNLYINAITKANPSYNFETSFKESPFCNASMKITNYTLHNILQLFKLL